MKKLMIFLEKNEWKSEADAFLKGQNLYAQSSSKGRIKDLLLQLALHLKEVLLWFTPRSLTYEKQHSKNKTGSNSFVQDTRTAGCISALSSRTCRATIAVVVSLPLLLQMLPLQKGASRNQTSRFTWHHSINTSVQCLEVEALCPPSCMVTRASAWSTHSCLACMPMEPAAATAPTTMVASEFYTKYRRAATGVARWLSDGLLMVWTIGLSGC